MAAEWYISTRVCDNGIEYKTKYPMPQSRGRALSGERKRRAVRRAEKSAASSALELGQTLNCNFQVSRDCYVTLSYSKTGMEILHSIADALPDGLSKRDALYEAAERFAADRFLKRLRRACRKAGVELRYAYVTSDMDAHTKRARRVHHHMVINAEALPLAQQCWREGGFAHGRLYSHHRGDLQELADYMIGQVRRRPGKSSYHPSRNLAAPIRTEPVRALHPMAELQVPRGCEKIWRSESMAGRPQHVRYWRPPELRKECMQI